jgi:predicted O-methyltransferase YrrM
LYTNPPPLRHGSLGAVFAKGEPALPSSRKLLLCLLSWNTREITLESLDALETEALTLQRLGHRAAICVVDNGSTDGAAEALESRRGELHVEHRIVLNPHNTGNSRARNQMIDCALEMDADYLFFCDGDIEVVPFSTFAMLRYMEAEGERLGCLGAYSFQCTPERERTTAFLYSLAGCSMQTSDVLALTQYGLFRCRMFSEGVRFEESGPFGEPGHGLEDVDLAFQIHARGYGNHYFSGMWYLHRNLSSSVGILRAQGINPRERYFARRDYMVAKWEHHPSASGPLRWLRSAQPPWPEEETAPATLRLYPGGEEIALPAEARDLAAQAASDMLDRTELEAIGYLLAAYPWKGQEAIVVEIGAYQGRTTVFMAKILDLFGHEAKIVSIDPFERCTPDNFNPQGSYARYMKNVRDNGVDRRCLALAAFSEDAAAAVPERIGVLVIDGWHYYDAVRSDLALYLPKVVPGGYVFLDDYGPSYPDVVRAVDEFLARDSEFEVLAKSYYVVLRRRAG